MRFQHPLESTGETQTIHHSGFGPWSLASDKRRITIVVCYCLIDHSMLWLKDFLMIRGLQDLWGFAYVSRPIDIGQRPIMFSFTTDRTSHIWMGYETLISRLEPKFRKFLNFWIIVILGQSLAQVKIFKMSWTFHYVHRKEARNTRRPLKTHYNLQIWKKSTFSDHSESF